RPRANLTFRPATKRRRIDSCSLKSDSCKACHIRIIFLFIQARFLQAMPRPHQLMFAQFPGLDRGTMRKNIGATVYLYLLFAAATVLGQSVNGSIGGIVQDPS